MTPGSHTPAIEKELLKEAAFRCGQIRARHNNWGEELTRDRWDGMYAEWEAAARKYGHAFVDACVEYVVAVFSAAPRLSSLPSQPTEDVKSLIARLCAYEHESWMTIGARPWVREAINALSRLQGEIERLRHANRTRADYDLRCQDCGRAHILDTSIPSDVWNKIAPDVGALCTTCIDDRLKKHGLTCEAEFYYAGDALQSKMYPEAAPAVDQDIGKLVEEWRQLQQDLCLPEGDRTDFRELGNLMAQALTTAVQEKADREAFYQESKRQFLELESAQRQRAEAAESALAAAREWTDRAKVALTKHGTHEEFDFPGDAPESCGWWCDLCNGAGGENGRDGARAIEHKPDCLLFDPASIATAAQPKGE
jgi:hypothetical protein